MSAKSKQVQAKSTSNQAPANELDLAKVMQSFSQNDVMAFAKKLDAAFDERKRFEISRVEGGSADLSIVKKLNKAHAKLSMPHLLRAMMALKTDPAFVNHSHSKDGNGPRFNIYAIDKAVDILNAIAGTKIGNKINLAMLRSMVLLEGKGSAMTSELAKLSVSAQMRSQNPLAKEIIRHTVAPVTASTQTSSTFRILQALGLVVNTGTKNAANYNFAKSPEAEAFKRLLIAA